MNENRGLWRGKSVDPEEWIEGYFAGYFLNERGEITPHILRSDNNDLEEVIPETLGECTGLTDKNGGKIFDGDILKTRAYVHCKAAVVMYSEGCFWVHNPSGGNMPLFKYIDMERGTADDVEVIGNLYDSPELFEGGESNG